MQAFGPVVHGIAYSDQLIRRRLAQRRVEIARIMRQSALEEAARAGEIVGISSPIEPRHSLKIEIHRIGSGRPFRAASLVGDQLGAQLTGEAGDDLVLQTE